jgi:ATP-binding cassette subfamily C (CFTR/MRP) protein 1
MGITVPFLLIAVAGLQHVYLRTSRQLRLLDIEANSPLYTHFLETLKGQATIRAMNWESRSMDRLFKLLDTSQRPYFLFQCIQLWLEMVLSLMTGALAVIVVGLATGLRSTTDPGLLGVSLTNVLGKWIK